MALDFFLRQGRVKSIPSPLGSRALLSVALLGAAAFPLSPGHLAKFEALNRELGKLCSSNPPKQATAVCRLHAKLVNAL
jgi:hypothetical protein